MSNFSAKNYELCLKISLLLYLHTLLYVLIHHTSNPFFIYILIHPTILSLTHCHPTILPQPRWCGIVAQCVSKSPLELYLWSLNDDISNNKQLDTYSIVDSYKILQWFFRATEDGLIWFLFCFLWFFILFFDVLVLPYNLSAVINI